MIRYFGITQISSYNDAAKFVAKNTLGLMFQSICIFLGIVGTDSAYQIWNDILTAYLDELFDADLRKQRLEKERYRDFMDKIYQREAEESRMRNFCEWFVIARERERYKNIEKYFGPKLKYFYGDVPIRSLLLLFSTIAVSFIIVGHYTRLNNIKSYYECQIALVKGEFPKLKYLGLAGKKLKAICFNIPTSIQIGLNKKQLDALYAHPISSSLIVPDYTFAYNKKELLKHRILVNNILSKKRKTIMLLPF